MRAASREQRLRDACGELDTRWRSGESAVAEPYLDAVPAEDLDAEFALELIYTEYLARERTGRQLTTDAWFERFPRWHEPLARLFEIHALAEETHRGGEEVLGSRVNAAFGGGVAGASSGPSLSATGDVAGLLVAGKYKLRQPIGAGGMGSVWLADQLEPVKRTVAVKLIRSEQHGSHLILSRFEAERQAIALMDHPHIAKLLDAGATDHQSGERPFFVMELVKGTPLNTFCDQHSLGISERLRLFMDICGAVQHAHQKGIIHRDLKPSNILVELHDDKPLPKVIDFGLAKALTGQLLIEHSVSTTFGGLTGTPLYMAPEQAVFNAVDIDTRADIYALGVILYELLTGTTPIEREAVKNLGLEDLLRLIRETEPPAPSQRLGSASSRANTAVNGRADPRKLGRFVCGELDWIVMKALAKERDRRYDTPNDLAKDIERFLNHEPVLAGPPGTIYVLRKFVKRNKARVLACALLLLAVLLGIAGTTYGLVKAERRRKEAERFRDRTREALDAMTSSVTGDSLSAQKELSEDQKKFLTEVLTYYQEFASEKADDERARARTAAAAHRVGTIERRLGRKPQALTAFQKAREAYSTLASEFPSTPEYRRGLGHSLDNLGKVLRDLEQNSEAEEAFRKALDLQVRLAAELPQVAAYREDLAKSHTGFGVLLHSLGRTAEAEGHFRQGLSIEESLSAEFPADSSYMQELAVGYNNLGLLLESVGKGPAAEPLFRDSIKLKETLARRFPHESGYRADLATGHNNLGNSLRRSGKRPEAETEHRQALVIQQELVEDFPNVPAYRRSLSMMQNNLGILLFESGDREGAEEHHRKALAIREQLTADFPNVPTYRAELAMTHINLGGVLTTAGQASQAEEHCLQAVAIQEKLASDFPEVPDYRRDLASAHSNLASLFNDAGELAKAVDQCRKSVLVGKQLVADFPDQPRHRLTLARSHNTLGGLLTRLGQGTAAKDEYLRALDLQEELAEEFPTLSEYRVDLATTHYNLGTLAYALSKWPHAEKHHRRALEIRQRLVEEVPQIPELRQDLAASHTNLGGLLYAMDKLPEAKEQYSKAVLLLEKLIEEFPGVADYQIQLGASYGNFGGLIRDSGRPDESLAWFEKAIGLLQSATERGPPSDAVRSYLLNSHWGRATAYSMLEQHTAAVPDWDQVVKLSPAEKKADYRVERCLSRLNAGQIAEAIDEVDELTATSMWNADQWYNFACLYSIASRKADEGKAGYADRAVQALRKAVQAGFTDAAHMAKDTDLDPLRDRPDFLEILAGLNGQETHESPPQEIRGPSTSGR